ncbi:MAG TPA: hypothetical protein VF558_11415 [Rubrobacteraceae bacterium]
MRSATEGAGFLADSIGRIGEASAFLLGAVDGRAPAGSSFLGVDGRVGTT